MPRPSSKSSKPSAAGRYAVSSGGVENGRQADLTELADPEGFLEWLATVVGTGAGITFAMTKDYKTITVTYFVDGERYPWYIQSRDDWDAMVLATSIDRD